MTATDLLTSLSFDLKLEAISGDYDGMKYEQSVVGHNDDIVSSVSAKRAITSQIS